MIDPRLERFLPIRVVIRRHADSKIEGLVEHSFSMAWAEDRVNIFWSGKAYSILGEHELDGVKNANGNCTPTEGDLFTPEELVIDPLAPDSPIEIDWNKWLSATSKFNKRNAPFVVRSTQPKLENENERSKI